MALLEYELKVDPKGNSTVTCVVLQVDKNDRIQFKSNNANAAVLYKKSTPFTGSGPKVGVPFPVGKKATPAFKVGRTLAAKQRIHFDCGEIQKTTGADSKGKVGWTSTTKKPPNGFISWGSGQTVPPRLPPPRL